MARSVLVDAGYLVALLSRRDQHHRWAALQSASVPPPWLTCEAVLSEAFHLIGPSGQPALVALLRRAAVVSRFDVGQELEPVLKLMQKYRNLPMSFADACLVRMTETRGEPLLLTTDDDFRVYRRHSRQVIPYLMP
jgi:predicted nucleic acid-binding protein